MVQHPDFSISVRCKDTTEKIELVRYDPKGRKQTDLARDHEVAQLSLGSETMQTCFRTV